MKQETDDSSNMSEEASKGEEKVPLSRSTKKRNLDKKELKNTKQTDESSNSEEKVKSADNNSRPVTPVQESEEISAPLTPTTNLKMLFSAVSPEIRHRESKMKDISIGTDDLNIEIVDPADYSDDYDWKPAGSRKEKSLGLLCAKFLNKYPENPTLKDKNVISLDEIAKELGVERRRIYDIVNVLESVEIVSRIAKNRYAWHGKSNLQVTLSKLKALGEAEGFGEQMKKLRDFELSRELAEQQAALAGQKAIEIPKVDIENFGGTSMMRKDKSLGIMSQKFIMLFLVSEPKTVNLDLAAKVLIGDANIDRSDYSKFKTKIRRLYDIANILTSLDLIRKVHVTEFRGRKPAFQYIGPDIIPMNDVSVCYNDGFHRPTSRHSLLDCVKNNKVADMISPDSKNTRTSEAQTNYDKKKKGSNTPKKSASFPRHSSFEQICEVAAKERQKLYESMSQPASPTQDLSGDEFTKSLSQGDTPTSTPPKKKSAAIQILHSKKNLNLDSEDPNKSRKAETIIIKTGIPACKNPTMIPLTKDQIDAVLKSLKVPVPLKGDRSSSEDSDDSELKSCCKRSATDSDSESAPKKIKVDFPSPPSDNDGEQHKNISEGSITPLALHKTPEFTGNSGSETNTCSDADLAVPLSEKDDDIDTNTLSSPTFEEMVGKVLKSSQSNVHRIAVQLPNQSPTILQFPVVSMESQAEAARVSTSHVQILQGMPVSTTGRNGQPINFMVPLTFSPPLTPDASQSLFTFPSPTTTMVTSGVTQKRKAITIPKFVTPTDRPVTTQFYRSTPGGLVPLTQVQISKETSSTVRKLDLPDISV